MEQSQLPSWIDRRASSRLPEVRFIRMKEVLAICGKSRSSVYEAMQKGEFPKPVKLGSRSSAWVKSEIEHWVQARIKARETQ
ncbi:helix-turn-helix transcriptional regulator [Massilia sp. TSP1-1-2]|uniref:helix-turn-helix transcriptional regulator n=1 Tax=Massilia sp. TSP1-1-2 TaxID=2804649 RepID=UPI003CF6CF00